MKLDEELVWEPITLIDTQLNQMLNLINKHTHQTFRTKIVIPDGNDVLKAMIYEEER